MKSSTKGDSDANDGSDRKEGVLVLVLVLLLVAMDVAVHLWV
jgi:hypothetical protein